MLSWDKQFGRHCPWVISDRSHPWTLVTAYKSIAPCYWSWETSDLVECYTHSQLKGEPSDRLIMLCCLYKPRLSAQKYSTYFPYTSITICFITSTIRERKQGRKKSSKRSYLTKKKFHLIHTIIHAVVATYPIVAPHPMVAMLLVSGGIGIAIANLYLATSSKAVIQSTHNNGTGATGTLWDGSNLLVISGRPCTPHTIGAGGKTRG